MVKLAKESRLFISSADRTDGDPGNFSIIFPNGPLVAGQGQYITVKLVDANICYSFYNITTDNINNNYFYLTENGVSKGKISISKGNYTIYDIQSLFQTALNAAGTLGYTISYNINTNIFTISTTNPGIAFLDFNPVNPNDDTAASILGFQNKTYVITGPSDPLVADYQAFVGFSGQLYIKINNTLDNYEQTNKITTPGQTSDQQWGTSQILAKIPVSSPPFSVIFYTDINNNYDCKWSSPNINAISIYITDEYGRVINLNGKDWTMTLKIEIWEREEDKIAEMADSLLAIQTQLDDQKETFEDIYLAINAIKEKVDAILIDKNNNNNYDEKPRGWENWERSDTDQNATGQVGNNNPPQAENGGTQENTNNQEIIE